MALCETIFLLYSAKVVALLQPAVLRMSSKEAPAFSAFDDEADLTLCAEYFNVSISALLSIDDVTALCGDT